MREFWRGIASSACVDPSFARMWHWAFVLVRWCSLFVATVATGESRTGESDARTGATCGAWFEFDLNWMSRSGGGNLDGDVGDGVEFCGRGDAETAVPRSTGDSSIPVPAIIKRRLASSAQQERTRPFYTPNLTSVAPPPAHMPHIRICLPPCSPPALPVVPQGEGGGPDRRGWQGWWEEK